jgi:hypothetical protein
MAKIVPAQVWYGYLSAIPSTMDTTSYIDLHSKAGVPSQAIWLRLSLRQSTFHLWDHGLEISTIPLSA